jgi:DICT domain-containing protein
VGAEIQKRAEIPGIEARAGKQITGGELRLLAGATTLSIEDERFRAQSGRFAACCKKLPNLKKLRDGREFALAMDLERREELLKKFERAAGEANAANPAAQVQSREGSEG